MTAPVLTMPVPRTTPLRGGPTLRWGVIAPGGIATDFVRALHTHTDQRAIAVASRSADRAHEFAARHGIPRAHDDYAALYSDEQVQIVYIAAPHSEHRRLATDAIAAGKHVLIEKPIGLCAEEAREIAAAARATGVFAMEAMWIRWEDVREVPAAVGGALVVVALNDAEHPLFVASAQMAAGALGVLKERGIGVPGEVAVATVDNNVFSTSTSPQLTTVDLHTAAKGAAMMATIVRLIRGEQLGADSALPLDLVVRESTAS